MKKLLLTFDTVSKYLVASILIAIPLYPKFPVVNVPGTYVSIRLEDFLILVSIIFFIINNINNWRVYFSNKIFLIIYLFISVGFLSLLSAIFITQTVSIPLGVLHWIRRLEYLSLFFVGYSYIRNKPKDLNFLLKLIPVVILFLFIYGLGQKYFNLPIIITQNEEYSKGVALRYVEGGHINSTFAGHYDLATYLVFTLPLILSFVIFTKKYTKLLFVFIYFCGLWLLVNTASRISFVSFIVSSSIALLLLKSFRKGFVYILISLLFIGFSSNLINRYERVLEILSNGVKKYTFIQTNTVYAQDAVFPRRDSPVPTPTPMPVFEDRSTSIRLNIEWPRAVRALVKNPLLGTGYSSITLATDNDYLRSLGETGILGFSSFALIFAWIGKRSLIFLKKDKINSNSESIFIASITGGFFGVLINALFIDVFEASKFALTLWLLLGFYYSIITRKT
jgi:hypothetical protein